jgi:hypothetical protein
VPEQPVKIYLSIGSNAHDRTDLKNSCFAFLKHVRHGIHVTRQQKRP